MLTSIHLAFKQQTTSFNGVYTLQVKKKKKIIFIFIIFI